MGLMDDFTADMGASEGVRYLSVLSVEFITSKQKGTPGLRLTFSSGGEHKMYKTLYQGKMFNRFLTSLIEDFCLKPHELEEASKNGMGEAWLIDNLTGKKGNVYCMYGEPNQEGKKYLEPVSFAEREFKKWIASQNAGKSSYGEPPLDNYQSAVPPDFPGDMGF